MLATKFAHITKLTGLANYIQPKQYWQISFHLNIKQDFAYLSIKNIDDVTKDDNRKKMI